ncbi:hypothetical protein K9N50_07345 [bacterium]|nr:hypothetical protein [bacterium]
MEQKGFTVVKISMIRTIVTSILMLALLMVSASGYAEYFKKEAAYSENESCSACHCEDDSDFSCNDDDDAKNCNENCECNLVLTITAYISEPARINPPFSQEILLHTEDTDPPQLPISSIYHPPDSL